MAASALIQLSKVHCLMNLWNHSLCTPIPIGIDRINFLIIFQQNIVHTPGVDGQAFDFPELVKGFQNAGYHMNKQLPYIPDQVSVFLADTIRKTVYFFRLNCATPACPQYDARKMHQYRLQDKDAKE